jgi:flagellar biosynthetic protein FlhB
VAEETTKDQKTEAATPRRREEAREKGQVALSSEMSTVLILIGWLFAIVVAGGTLARAAAASVGSGIGELARLGTIEMSTTDAARICMSAMAHPARACLVLIVPILFLAALVSYGQIGFRVAPKAVSMDLAKINPIKGLERLFSARSVVRTLMALLKMLIVLSTVALIAWAHIEEIVALAGSDLGPTLAGTGQVSLRCVAGAIGAMLCLALFDFLFQRWQHDRDLRMSRQELLQEHKSTEGDPHLRARIRSLQREMASRRMMSEVPKATVIVTNPTHYAVALLYERDQEGRSSRAPRVVAKGVDHVAERIKRVAREHGVTCYENVALARTLHARVEIGEEIPVDLYSAVAEIVAAVFRAGDSAPKRAA